MERIRIMHKESGFTTIDNGIFRDRELTLAERGFLCTILSFPDDWDFSTKGMCELLQEGMSAIKSTINRLIEHGYCKAERVFDKQSGKILGYDYTFFEVKNGIGCTSEPQVGFPPMENPAMENQHQLNTKELNNYIYTPSLSKERVSPKQPSELFGEESTPQPPSLSDSVERIYAFYPAKCPVKGRSTGKSKSDKAKIARLLKDRTEEDLTGIIRRYLDECVSSGTPIKNLSTLLNNLPDYSQDSKGQWKPTTTKPQSKFDQYRDVARRLGLINDGTEQESDIDEQ